ncbi:MAG: hypothetical protein ACT4PO_04995, partial [Actinomycetota bacterium]
PLSDLSARSSRFSATSVPGVSESTWLVGSRLVTSSERFRRVPLDLPRRRSFASKPHQGLSQPMKRLGPGPFPVGDQLPLVRLVAPSKICIEIVVDVVGP